MTKSLMAMLISSAQRRAFQASHFEAADIFTEDVIFYELINREWLDYRARNAECFYVSKRPVGALRESTTQIFIEGTHKFGPRFALIRHCFDEFRFSSVAELKNQRK